MKEHEHTKIMRDTQYFKDRCDQALLQLKYAQREKEELELTKMQCDEILVKEVARVEKE